MALISVEAKYMEASQVACEAIWMRKNFVGLFGSHMDLTVIHYDNQSCIKLSINHVFHDRSKHIDIWYHHLRDCVQRRIPGENSNTIEAGSMWQIIPFVLRGSVDVQQEIAAHTLVWDQ